MRVGIDVRLWNQTGVGRYIRNLVINLQELDKENSYFLFGTKTDRGDIEKAIKNSNWKFVLANYRWHSLGEQFFLPRALKKEKLDLVHFPYFSVPLFYKNPYVVTVHDLILHHFPTGEASTLPVWLYGFKMLFYRLIINNAAHRAKKIIAVSNATKDEVIDHLFTDKRKVEVIYEAADDFLVQDGSKPDFSNYFLFVGNVYPHKNAEKLVEAFKLVSEKNKDVKLVFVGKEDFFSKRLKSRYSKLIKSGQLIFIENADDKTLSSLYKNSLSLVRPSLMEGFSLPPLEAMMAGGLVIASDIPVHKEIFGENIFYFDPKNIQDVAKQMEAIINLGSVERGEKIRKGQELAKKYSWRDTALKTLGLYKSAGNLE